MNAEEAIPEKRTVKGEPKGTPFLYESNKKKQWFLAISIKCKNPKKIIALMI